jgi:exonuclease SbcD
MAVRILHTSDWHLGVSIKSQGVGDEHEAFFDWLLDEIDDRQADVLVVAGDVFHYATPSNAARQRYYDFLVECAAQETLEQVVVVGGNHDSPSGLDAPRDLLRSLDIHVVGGLPYDEVEQIERCLVPVGDPEDPELVIAAVPYARRAQLGVALEDDSGRSMHDRYQQAFADLYGRLAEAAGERFPGVPCVATGHLTCYAASNEPERGDYHSAIHGTTDTREFDGEVESVGNIGAMRPDAVFGDNYEYVALGHIHRMMRVGDGPVWYAGTPVATSRDESSGRYVLQVDVESAGDEAAIEVREVPIWRELIDMTGTEKELTAKFGDLEWDSELPPYLFLDVEIDRDELQGETKARLKDDLADRFPEADERPRIVGYREYDPDAEPLELENDVPPLEDLSPREVFQRRYRSKHGVEADPPEELTDAFAQIEQAYHDGDRGK